ncbi:MAG: 4-hydroxy-tetrahydrodipicolinate reductase [Flammeovirgaceae bacterium]
MIRIGLIGFGRTGKLVAQEIIKDPECTLVWVIKTHEVEEDEFASHLLGFKQNEGRFFTKSIFTDIQSFVAQNFVDVVIDFSDKSAICEYQSVAKLGVRIVTAISNYSPREISLIKDLSQKTAIVLSPNITLGINFLIVISKILRKIAKEADVEIVEEHFRDKAEVSGTALKIAEQLGLDKQKHVNSIRVGGIVGKHEVIFGLPNQTIRVIHESHNRAAFGRGAIFAAKWLMSKNTGLYSMENIIREEFVTSLDDEIQSLKA